MMSTRYYYYCSRTSSTKTPKLLPRKQHRRRNPTAVQMVGDIDKYEAVSMRGEVGQAVIRT